MSEYNSEHYQRARLARDARFDGLFFIGVKSTKIYCRPICPVAPPKEENVVYFDSAIAAARSGFRPCLRCHPDSAPQSNRWQGVLTSLQRALKLIDQGALQEGSVSELATRLGITDRYLRKLFDRHLGISPKAYALYQQCLFAKQLLHQSALPITQVALASGFNSLRRFNDSFKSAFGLTPTQVRRSDTGEITTDLRLKLYFRPPFAWPAMSKFLRARTVAGLEWCEDGGYGRTIEYGSSSGYFEVRPDPERHFLWLKLSLNNWHNLNLIVRQIRRLFDLDANSLSIDSQLRPLLQSPLKYHPGLRLPGVWSPFEAGVRAVLGQQVSVSTAVNLVTAVVAELGCPLTGDKMLFPTPAAIAQSDLGFLRMPGARKATLQRLAQWYQQADDPDNIDQWLALKGIGPWTVDYVKMRGLSHPDIWLASDLGVQRMLRTANDRPDPTQAAPWRSYLTFQLWQQ